MNMYSDDEDMSDTDALLQRAFAKGELKPGTVVLKRRGEDGESEEEIESKENEKQPYINKVEKIQAKVKELKLPATFSWVERLDIVNDLAPLAPQIALQLDDHRERREKSIRNDNQKKRKKSTVTGPILKSVEDDPIHNDFKREMNFYRQAQQAILKCLPRLKELKVPTKRPDDYFAEMAKSDAHMQKVASVLLKKQTATERSEKVRKIRDQKKFAKQTQVQAIQEKHKAKRELMNSVKKFKEGQKNALDFLDDEDDKKGQSSSNKKERNEGAGGRGERGTSRGTTRGRINYKREGKNEKYGYGGKKKGAKYNTKDSVDDIDDAQGGRGGFSRGRGGRGLSRGRSGGRGGFSSRGRDGSSSRGRGGSSFRGRSSDRGDSSSRGRSGGRGGSSFRGRSGGRGDSSRGGSSFRGRSGGRGDSSRGGSSFRGRSGGRGDSSSRGRGGSRGGFSGRGRDGSSQRGRGGFSSRGGKFSGRGRGK